jgi:internalin A
MRVRTIVAALGLALLAADAASAGDDSASGAVTVMVDGAIGRVRVLSIEGVAEARPDDLVEVGDFVVPRGTEKWLRFRTDGGKLWQFCADKTQRLVGATAVGRKADGTFDQEPDEGIEYMGEKPVVDSLSSLSDAEIASLRCVRVMGWSDEIAAKLGKTDAAKTCYVVARGDKRPIPPLPAAAQFVVLRSRHEGSGGPGDLAPLAKLASLRLLHLGPHYVETTDLSPLAGLAQLQHLDLGVREVSHAQALSGLKSLRVLFAYGCKGISDVAFAASMPGLRTINVSDTKVADLSPLSDHAELRVIHADLAPVRVLPKGDLRALREFRMMSAPASNDDVEAFMRVHPDCKVVHGWRGLLVAAVADADRVRVRSGGTCHRNFKEEKTLLELTTRDDVAAFVDMLRLDESGPGSMCMCCGTPTFEFYAGKKLIASLGYHHGRTLRWPDGAWPGDAVVAPESADKLCEWLAKRGVTGPIEERDAAKRRAETIRRRDERQAALLPKDVRDALEKRDGAAAAFARVAPDAADRVLLCFRLIGCAADEGHDDVTRAARRALAAEKPDVVAQVAKHALDDDEAGRGVAYWLFERDAEPKFDDAALDAIVARAATRLLSDADPKVRGEAITGLRHVARPASIELLRKVLGGTTMTSPPVAETARNMRCAVDSLLELGDRESVPRMREIAATWDEKSRAEFEKELERMEKGAGGK